MNLFLFFFCFFVIFFFFAFCLILLLQQGAGVETGMQLQGCTTCLLEEAGVHVCNNAANAVLHKPSNAGAVLQHLFWPCFSVGY